MSTELQDGDVIERKTADASFSTLSVALHPIVLMCISDHYTRLTVAQRQLGAGGAEAAAAEPVIRAAGGGPSTPPRVIGALLGTQEGRAIEIHTTTELVLHLNEMSGEVEVDPVFMTEKLAEIAKVFPTYEFVGWYSIGEKIQREDVLIHKQFLEVNESPLVLLLDAKAAFNPATKDLPVQLYEPEIRMINERAATLFSPASYRIETNEAERVSVDHVAHMSGADATNESNQLQSHLSSMHSAINMLRVRVNLLLKYLRAVEAGELPFDHELLLRASSLCALLPALDSPSFRDDFFTEHNDGLLVAYLAVMTKNLGLVNELVDRGNIAYDVGGSGGGGGGRQRERERLGGGFSRHITID